MNNVIVLEQRRRLRESPELRSLADGLDFADDAGAALYGAAQKLQKAGYPEQAAAYLRLYHEERRTRQQLPDRVPAA